MNHLDLATLPWTLTRADAPSDIFAAVVPGCVHTALLHAGRIEDPFAVGAEERLKWIGLSDWLYRVEFPVTANLLAAEHVELCAYHLDTLATVRVNGVEVGSADNQFRLWRWDVRAALLPGPNTLEIHFASADRWLESRFAEPILRDGIDVRPLLAKPRSFLRKMACAWGWDWGVSHPSVGILGAIRLESWSTNRLVSVQVRQRHRPGVAELTLVPEIAHPDGVGELRAVLRFGGAVAATFTNHEAIVRQPRLWWPNGLGEQPLYDLDVELIDAAGRVLDTWSRRIGLRELRFLSEPDAIGRSFEFEVNRHRFYAKGSNWVPISPFASDSDSRRAPLLAAHQAHLNMIRIWGGGIYEPASFYETCDELGLLVWQDFMFACANYPAFDRALLANIAAEARDQVRRLRHHACLALWCGNNEIDGNQADAWGTDPSAPWGRRRKVASWRDYDALFNGVLPAAIRELAPEQSYIPSSPHDPDDRRRHDDRTGAGMWYERSGDLHFWNCWFGERPAIAQRASAPRFASEFGFQSAPVLSTLRSIGFPPEAPLAEIDSVQLAHRQRCHKGNERLLRLTAREFGGSGDTIGDFAWRTHLLEAFCLKYAIEHWRTGGGRNRGALVWQLNDFWPGFTWSTVDHSGRWKPAHHVLKRAYAPLLLVGIEHREARTVQFIAANDRREPVAAEFRWALWSAAGERIFQSEAEPAVIAGGGWIKDFGTVEINHLINLHGEGRVLVHLELQVEGRVVAEDMVHHVVPAQLLLEDPQLSVEVLSQNGNRARVRLSVQRPALWVTFTDERVVHAEDDAFPLLPDRPRELDLELTAGASAADLRLTSWRGTEPR